MKLFDRSHLTNRRIGALILLTVLLACGPAALADRKEGNPDLSGAATGVSPTPTPPKFNIPIPPGHHAHGVTIPYYDAKGKLQMFFNINSALRVDMNHLNMERAYMVSYDEKGTPDTNVYMARSVLDLDTRVVTSDVPVVVNRSDFVIVGQKMIFNTQTRVGQMSGHVRMIIFNRQDTAEVSPSPSPSSGTAPSASPQPSATP
jgi:hypothetical protein